MASQPENDVLNHVKQLIATDEIGAALYVLRDLAGRHSERPEIFNLAGECLNRVGDSAAALDAFRRAATLRPEWVQPHLGAAQALAARGDASAAMQAIMHALRLKPGHLAGTRQLVELLARLRPDRHLAALEPALLESFRHPDVDPTPLTRLCGQQLRFGVTDVLDTSAKRLPVAATARIAGSELWLHYLSRVVNADPFLERLLVRLRKQLLAYAEPGNKGDIPLTLVAALAQQCFLNEYVFPQDEEEIAQLVNIDRLARHSGGETRTAAVAFAVSCSYRAPTPDASTRSLAELLVADQPWLESLCRLTVFEPCEEAKLANALPVLHPIRRQVSLDVQAQYEVNPYPRWQVPPAPDNADLLADIRRRYSLRADEQRRSGPARLLVAGCGTGFEPIDIARRDSSIAITAVDLSLGSLAYAARKARQLGCESIDFCQGDILDLPDTDWRFDVIVCSGVLHHMEDPLAGWEVLCRLLAPHGMMRIGLYSAHARRDVSRVRELVRARGWTGDADNIRKLRAELLEQGEAGEFSDVLHSSDFYSMSGCRDLLFHVQEKQFTLPEIQSALDRLGLVFGGFDIADPGVLAAYTAQNPAPNALRDLEAWDRFERANPRAFSGMYQFWCERAAA